MFTHCPNPKVPPTVTDPSAKHSAAVGAAGWLVGPFYPHPPLIIINVVVVVDDDVVDKMRQWGEFSGLSDVNFTIIRTHENLRR